MDPQAWAAAKSLLMNAAALPPHEWKAYLDAHCGDAAVRAELLAMLSNPIALSDVITPPVLAPGTALGCYIVETLLGAGGMGQVYRARDTKLARAVAIKVLPVDVADDAQRLQRFKQEAQLLAALNHPHIASIYGLEDAGGIRFLVMELIEGRSLAEQIAKGTLKPREALTIAIDIGGALRAAHRAGIIHRDLKPANIMLGPSGAKLLDFGLATRSAHEFPLATVSAQTAPGTIMGTLPYMAPEQVQGRPTDARTDIFAFGCVLYEMFTGKRAFEADSQATLAVAILEHDPPPPSSLQPAVSPALERVVTRCLRKDPGERWQSAADLTSELQWLATQTDSAIGTVAKPRASRLRPRTILVTRALSWRRRILAALLVLAPIAGLFAWQAWRATSPERPFRAVALTTFSGIEWWPSLSPDGNNVAFMWTGPTQDNPDVYVQMIGSSGGPLRLTADPRADYNPVWSPDGRWIAFLRAEQLPRANGAPAGKSELWLIPPLGGPGRTLAKIQARAVDMEGFLAWCPDSSCLVVTDSPGEGKPDALFVVSRETGEKTQLTSPVSPLAGDTNPAVSHDGRWLVFRRVSSYSASELCLLRLRTGTGLTASGEPLRLTRGASDAQYPTWMPDSKEILFSAEGRLWRMPISGEKPPEQLPLVGENGLMPVVSRDQPGRPSRLVYARSFVDSNIWRVDTSAPGGPASSPPVAAISSTQMDTVGDLSPDGRRMAFSSTRTGKWEVWVAEPDGANAFPLTSTASGIANAPRWSPDSQLIAFQSSLEGQFDICLIPANGGRPRRITSHPANDLTPSFSRDGQWIYFSSNRTGDYQIWKVSARGGDAVQVTRNDGYSGVEGVDGAYLYYMEVPRGELSPLWRVPVSGGQPVRVLEGVLNFAVINSGVYYLARRGKEARLEFLAFATGKSMTVVRHLGDVQGLLAASRDGRTIFFTRQDSSVRDLMLVDNFR